MNRFFYAIKQSIIQIFRNKGMSLASIFAITAMLLILGMFFALILNITMAAEGIKKDYRNIEVFLNEDVKDNGVGEIQERINSIKGVENTIFRSKDEAMQILKERWGSNSYLLDGLAENPLPNSIIVEMKNLDKADLISKECQNISGVEDIKYYKNTVDKLLKATKILQISAIVIMIFLILVATVVVANTIKLTVLARSEEIVIMKYVGATNWFIRAPFLFEGIIIGIVSAFIAWGILIVAYNGAASSMAKQFTAISMIQVISIKYLGEQMIYIFVALGSSIGAWGSMISLRRFLDT